MNKEFVVSSELDDFKKFMEKVEELENKYGVKVLASDDVKNLKRGDKISYIEDFTYDRVTYEFLAMCPEEENYCFFMDSWSKKKTLRLYIPSVDTQRFYIGYNPQFMAELCILYHARRIAHYLSWGVA